MCSTGCKVNKNLISEIKKLTSSLEKINIPTFIYFRLNTKNQYCLLSNKENILEDLFNKKEFVNKIFVELAEKSNYGKMSIALWEKSQNNTLSTEIRELELEHGISLALPFQEHIEIYSFASSVGSEEMPNFFINHLKLLKHFIIYFRLHGDKFIQYANNNFSQVLGKSLHLYNLNNKNADEKLAHLRDCLIPKRISIRTAQKDEILLTENETSALILLLAGKSMYTIAKELGLSKSTVESCLATIKLKTGYYSKSQLLAAFLENQIYQPSMMYDRYY